MAGVICSGHLQNTKSSAHQRLNLMLAALPGTEWLHASYGRPCTSCTHAPTQASEAEQRERREAAELANRGKAGLAGLPTSIEGFQVGGMGGMGLHRTAWATWHADVINISMHYKLYQLFCDSHF